VLHLSRRFAPPSPRHVMVVPRGSTGRMRAGSLRTPQREPRWLRGGLARRASALPPLRTNCLAALPGIDGRSRNAAIALGHAATIPWALCKAVPRRRYASARDPRGGWAGSTERQAPGAKALPSAGSTMIVGREQDARTPTPGNAAAARSKSCGVLPATQVPSASATSASIEVPGAGPPERNDPIHCGGRRPVPGARRRRLSGVEEPVTAVLPPKRILRDWRPRAARTRRGRPKPPQGMNPGGSEG